MFTEITVSGIVYSYKLTYLSNPVGYKVPSDLRCEIDTETSRIQMSPGLLQYRENPWLFPSLSSYLRSTERTIRLTQTQRQFLAKDTLQTKDVLRMQVRMTCRLNKMLHQLTGSSICTT
jgi:hypothetical protein